MKKIDIIDGKKACTNCNIVKPVCDFSKKAFVKSGISSQCKECLKIKSKLYNARPDVKKRMSDYSKREEVKQRQKIIQKVVRKKRSIRYHSDSLYKTVCKVRNNITKAYKRNNRAFIKKSKTLDIIGIPFVELHLYLQNTFTSRYNRLPTPEDKVELDHIIPISTARCTEDVERLNHYSNLQLLTREDNLKKSNNTSWKDE
jgi:hypothetical protein